MHLHKTSKTLEISDGLPSGENTQIWILIVSFGNVVDKDKLITAVWKRAGDALPGPLGSRFPRRGEGHPDCKRKLISLKTWFGAWYGFLISGCTGLYQKKNKMYRTDSVLMYTKPKLG